MAGGVLISTGMVVASFARTVVDMYVTIGVISGESSRSCTCPTLCWLLRLLARGVLLPTTRGVLEKRCCPLRAAVALPAEVVAWAGRLAFCPVSSWGPAQDGVLQTIALAPLDRSLLVDWDRWGDESCSRGQIL